MTDDLKMSTKNVKYDKKFGKPLKNKKKRGYNEKEEKNLENLVFGNDDLSDDDFKPKIVESKIQVESKKRKSAWIDEDDAQYSVKEASKDQKKKYVAKKNEAVFVDVLKTKFKAIYGDPEWARLDKESNGDSDDEMLQHSNHIAPSKTKNLPKSRIDLKSLKEINHETKNEGPWITSVEFHPTSTVALVAGSSGTLSIFSVDGRLNSKLSSLKYERYPISCSKFLKEGTEILSGSMSYNYCYSYDLLSGSNKKVLCPHGVTNMKNFEVSPDEKMLAVKGRFGEIFMLSSASKELLYTLKMNTKCNSVAFTPDGNTLISHGESHEMYVWDLREQRCIHRAFDDGCISNKTIAISPSGQFLATGSKQGIVNVYNLKNVIDTQAPKPLKIFTTLVTSITSLKFNPTSEILAMASSVKSNAFKMAHLPSFTVFENFPTFQTVMHLPTVIEFSPKSGWMSVGNNQGSAYLYKLKHYGNY